jgi:hypothetical protein
VRFRIDAHARPAKGDVARVRNGTPLALEAHGLLVGTFTDAHVSGCLALGFSFDGVITAVDEAMGIAELRGR